MLFIYLLDFCANENIDFEKELDFIWTRVQNRNWKANNKDGISPSIICPNCGSNDFIKRHHEGDFNLLECYFLECSDCNTRFNYV